jgi:hypothetical protein
MTSELTDGYKAYLREELQEILPKSQHNKIDRIIGLIDPDRDVVNTVEVGQRALIAVETIEAYGLIIGLDALGEASDVSHRDGLVVVG